MTSSRENESMHDAAGSPTQVERAGAVVLHERVEREANTALTGNVTP